MRYGLFPLRDGYFGSFCSPAGSCVNMWQAGCYGSLLHERVRNMASQHSLCVSKRAVRDEKCEVWIWGENKNKTKLVSLLVSRCFKPSQSQRVTSGLKETFIKNYIVERTNKAEIRPEEQSEKAECCRENLWNEIQLKGP